MEHVGKILIVDDKPAIRTALREILEHEDYVVCEADSGQQALDLLKQERIILALIDVELHGMNGIETLEHIHANYDFHIIMISSNASIGQAVEAIKKGAYDYLQFPIDLNRLLISSRNAIENGRLVIETRNLKKQINQKYKMLGESVEMNRVKSVIDKVAPTDARVMIVGASGVGKELVARALHDKSKRAAAPFVEVNCAAIPNELIESQLFGHEKGAFTSAIKMKKGDFELADGGTIFFDEIADMSLEAQAKVLRALQENKIIRVGGEKEITVNVRVIAATNKNLQEEIAAKRFREDLYHRLSVIVIGVPTLNERLDDIPLLVSHFNKEFSANAGEPPREFSPDAIEELQKYHWTGNVRQLRNVVERLLILCNNVITADDVCKYTYRVQK